MYRTQFPVPFQLVDSAGVVFFGHSFSFAHQALEAFVVHAGVEWKDWFQSAQYGIPVRAASAEYLSPILGGASCETNIAVLKLGDSSVTFRVEVRQQERLCSVVTTTHVFVDRTTGEKASIPPAFREPLSLFIEKKP